MSKKKWLESDSERDLDPISSLLSEWSDPEEEEEEFRSDFFQGLSGRRRKAAFVLMAVWSITIALYLVSWGFWVVLALTSLLSIQAIRFVIACPESASVLLAEDSVGAPAVTLVVAAKNEAAVIGNLVKNLCHLDYPADRYEVWIVDDRSTDETPKILDRLVQEYPQLQVLHRSAGASGGKSGALNQVLPLTKGEIVGVFDADAQVPADILRRVVPLFSEPEIGAVQARKAITNAPENFWTLGQMAEMALDSTIQQHRIAIGGIGELRGNGQFVRRTALERCGGWNEQTITDDLDLTIRLHLDRWKIGFLEFPAVAEEGVTNAIALWHQRSRWAEGGYQRYLDYWRLIASNRMGFSKTLDLLSFMLLQYLLPTAAVPDLLMVVTRQRLSLLSPLSGLLLSLCCWAMFTGLRRTQRERLSFATLVVIALQTLRGMVYMLHWLFVIASTTARLSVRPKRLKWVKTVHEGSSEESFV
ncbi:MAG: glycosyltransferase [Cyanophyceae cyanobacterium]